jgi:hypothetical protein
MEFQKDSRRGEGKRNRDRRTGGGVKKRKKQLCGPEAQLAMADR